MSPELTPNSFVDGRMGPKLLADKTVGISTVTNTELMDDIVSRVPFQFCGRREGRIDSHIVGTGDWAGGRSKEGSAVMELGDWVVKLPLGDTERDSHVWAVGWNHMISKLASVSVPTFVVEAEVDGWGSKPVVVQKRVDGQPLCNTPWSQILQTQTLEDVKHIIVAAREVYRDTNTVDVWGQKFGNKWVSRAASFIPFLSDNIMVDKEGRAYLVDNTPDPEQHKIESSKRAVMTEVRLGVMEKMVNCALWAVRLRDELRLMKPAAGID